MVFWYWVVTNVYLIGNHLCIQNPLQTIIFREVITSKLPIWIHYSYYLWYIYYNASHPLIYRTGTKKDSPCSQRNYSGGGGSSGSGGEHRETILGMGMVQRALNGKDLHKVLVNVLCPLFPHKVIPPIVK